jgi:hypothetical protein
MAAFVNFTDAVTLDEKFATSESTAMPIPLVSPFGKRQPRALVVGLRRVVKDPRATVAQRLEACKLLALIEGYIQSHARERIQEEAETAGKPQNFASRAPTSAKNLNRLLELAEQMRKEKPGEVLPDISASASLCE